MADILEKYTKPPVVASETQNTGVTETSATTETQTPSTETSTPTQQAESGTAAATQVETKPDQFIEDLNKRFGTQFKADTEVKDIFGLPQKIATYESELTKTKDYASRIEQYEKQLEEYKSNANTANLLEKPLIRQAFVAQQLQEKYPDKDAETLRQIVMSDVSKMSDVDVLVKAQKINHPTIAESDLKAAIYRKHGIDPDTKPEEWDSVTRAELAMSADDARASIKTLTSGIEFPKAVTKEQRDADAQVALQKRIQETNPLKADFLAFDKFKRGTIDYDVPADYKEKLPDMFQAMFIDAGMEPTKENLQTAIELRDATFLYQNLDKIIEVAVKANQVEIQKKLDEALHNTQPPNTATATDESTDNKDTRKGLGAFLTDMQSH
jgi:hypothetical protein